VGGARPLATNHLSLTTALKSSDQCSVSSGSHSSPATSRWPLFLVTAFLLLPGCLLPSALAQTETATIAGRVSDPSGAVIPNATLHLVNIDKGTETDTKTNGSGLYTFPAVQPGRYRIEVQRDGFKVTNITGLVVNVQDNLEENFRLEVGSTSESVTVNGSGLTINTTDASVSTVVDRQFVDSMPLNGRSFQSLILLAPGVVTASPQTGAASGISGEYSVNGERADANNFMVDGVSANNSVTPYGYSSSASAGALPSTSALGTTQALVSVDALQEFRIQTSTYSAEFGRQPGGQISIQTRSGTNDWHGSAYDYLRNDVFDANNWFNDDSTPVIKKPAERQNDFGGTVGGPLQIPRLYSGKDRTFFFFSYEGLRLSQPQPATLLYVPSIQLREQAPTVIQGPLNAFPLPNCTTATNSECIDPGNGLSPFLLSTSLPSSLDAISLRFDEHPVSWLHLFFRYGSTRSSAQTTASTTEAFTTTNSKTFTLGGESSLGPRISNQLRLNYSMAAAADADREVSYGGAVAYDLHAAHNLASDQGLIAFELPFSGYGFPSVESGATAPKQHQSNVVDTLEKQQGRHILHFGVDYRRTSSSTGVNSPDIVYQYKSSQSVLANSPAGFTEVSSLQHPEFTNFSAFAQDEWRVSRAIHLSLGLRWELNPPPSVTSGVANRTVNGNLEDPSGLTLAAPGTPLYHSTYYNLAPRVGLAAILQNTPGRETVFRAGAGVFYDTGQDFLALFGSGASPGTGASASFSAGTPGTAFPISPTFYDYSLESTLTPPYSTIRMPSQHLQLPYSFHWNATLEQSLGATQSISLGYIGSNGRRLIEQSTYSLAALNPLFTSIIEYHNGLSSSYNALQLQYNRRLSRGLQVLGSYTWSHSLDYASQDESIFNYQRGNSDFDVRNNLTAALSYDFPTHLGSEIVSALLESWGADFRFSARSGFPVALSGNEFLDPLTGAEVYSGLNLVPGVPIYLYGQYPGGRRLNPAAFTLPSGTQVGNAPRNFARGFGEDELDLALRRELPIYERVRLQFRADGFNILNHPNFGEIYPYYGSALFGQATATLASSLGGLSSLYQQGGPRSLQFSLRAQF